MYKINSGSSSAPAETEAVAIALSSAETTSHPANNCESNSHNSLTKIANEQQLKYLLSGLLKYGVLMASAVVLLGGILYLIRHGSEPVSYQVFHSELSQFRSPVAVVKAVLAGSRRGLIQLGLLLLIAIPFVRVIISWLTFLIQRQFTYVIITSLVLISLIYSLVSAYL
jgi:uncharacterized membrane protein